MIIISELQKKFIGKLDFLDLELIIAHVLKKNREFVLSHPELTITKKQETITNKLITRRKKHEPIAYILGEKEFYGLKFKVDKYTLIPRPETELLVGETLKIIQDTKYNIQNTKVVDIGTGSGNIIIAIAKNFEFQVSSLELIGTDISKKALSVAKQNAKFHKVENEIKFLHGDLLDPILKNTKYRIPNTKYIILANLPYLSQKIYNSTPKDVKRYEPKTALFSKEEGLKHYKDLLRQIKEIKYKIPYAKYQILFEISPEQKVSLFKLIKSLFPKAKIGFKKDLAGKWRICSFSI